MPVARSAVEREEPCRTDAEGRGVGQVRRRAVVKPQYNAPAAIY
ncbi:MAG: hypothetical protein ABW185_18825 [Sedimenticola sp.]